MECREVRQNLDRYLEQALPDEQSRAVEEHLNQCAGCWDELIALREICIDLDDPYVQQMVTDEPAPLPADFTATVMNRILAEQPKGINLVWPWLRQKWSHRQYASAAYAMTATMVVVSAGNLLFLWSESTNRLAMWGVQFQAYWNATQAYMGVPSDYIASAWHTLLTLLHLA